jgi:multiple sugar transport system permease protein
MFLGMTIAVCAAYSLSKKHFKGRNMIFKLNTLSMMFVATAVSIPRYLVVKNVGLLDSFWANIIPMLAAPVTVFLLKQFVDQLPDALVESAKIDGATDYQIIWKIVLPLVKPAMATVAIQLFQTSWNSMEASNLFINTESIKTFAFYMHSLSVSGNGVAGMGMSAAASLLMFLPNVILFTFMQSNVMSTMAHSGLK